MRLLLLASAGGAIGAGARYLVHLGIARLVGTSFPWATLSINVLGCLLMGVVVEILVLRLDGSPELRTFLAAGILGGFTTFSAFALDVVALISRHEPVAAVLYASASVTLSILGLYLGLVLARAALV
jgi:fluoride exporter